MITPRAILAEINIYRDFFELDPLTSTAKLNESASLKNADMTAKCYIDHDDPEGASWTQFLDKVNYEPTVAYELIAWGINDSEAVVQSWINSDNHRLALLDRSVTEIGVDVLDTNRCDGKTYVTVHIAEPDIAQFDLLYDPVTSVVLGFCMILFILGSFVLLFKGIITKD